MPSPVAHSIIGITIWSALRIPRRLGWFALPRWLWQQRNWLLLIIFLANAPDLDLLFGLLQGNLNAYHQTVTHTLFWISLVTVCTWLLLRRHKANHPAPGLVLIFILLTSHLAADLVCQDYSPPYGLMLGWPFSSQYWHSPISIFPAIAKKDLWDLWSWHNLQAVLTEIWITLPFLVLVYAYVRAKFRK